MTTDRIMMRYMKYDGNTIFGYIFNHVFVKPWKKGYDAISIVSDSQHEKAFVCYQISAIDFWKNKLTSSATWLNILMFIFGGFVIQSIIKFIMLPDVWNVLYIIFVTFLLIFVLFVKYKYVDIFAMNRLTKMLDNIRNDINYGPGEKDFFVNSILFKGHVPHRDEMPIYYFSHPDISEMKDISMRNRRMLLKELKKSNELFLLTLESSENDSWQDAMEKLEKDTEVEWQIDSLLVNVQEILANQRLRK